MREKAISGMMAETHMRDVGVNQRIFQFEMVTKQKDERISQLAEKVSILQHQHESYRDIVIHEANVQQGPLPVSAWYEC